MAKPGKRATEEPGGPGGIRVIPLWIRNFLLFGLMISLAACAAYVGSGGTYPYGYPYYNYPYLYGYPYYYYPYYSYPHGYYYYPYRRYGPAAIRGGRLGGGPGPYPGRFGTGRGPWPGGFGRGPHR